MSIDLYSSNVKLTPSKFESVGWNWESESKSELQSEAKSESEPDWKRPRLELEDIDDDVEDIDDDVEDIDDMEESDDAWSIDYNESESESELQSEAIAESELDCKAAPWESKRVDDVELSELKAIYDNSIVPFDFRNKHFWYQNSAAIEYEQTLAEYRERVRNQPNWPWDAPPLPPNLMLCGSIAPVSITEKDRPRLNDFCKLALNNYNADQGANFVFDDLVKSTSALVKGWKYYITFMAKDASSDTAALTFQTEVYVHPKVGPEVILCRMEPTT